MSEPDLREELVAAAHSLFQRSLTHGRTGNISVRAGDRVLITPTGSSLGSVRADDLAVIDLDGSHLGGRKPSKEAFLHLAVFRARPEATAVVHTHSTYSAAVSCLADVDPDNVLPPLTAYFVMRVGRLPLLPYHAPGDDALGPLAESAARAHRALLLGNHGPVAAGSTLSEAVDALEEIEETAKLFLLLRGLPVRPVTTRHVNQAPSIAP
ncbi:aldolase [Microbispora sp. NEAU-D428]|uniref:3-oxo-tetronate 4-phosphate decarboxylase n=1 Tax=Microbispora sitophila TaxID=2771537 RepID=UPI0018688276|nr:3-oxo-tetronate 4-phosphate decarboxylase [Microbispora sitophila]MBE3015523.1 aldolase [Microbispora sitophila]